MERSDLAQEGSVKGMLDACTTVKLAACTYCGVMVLSCLSSLAGIEQAGRVGII